MLFLILLSTLSVDCLPALSRSSLKSLEQLDDFDLLLPSTLKFEDTVPSELLFYQYTLAVMPEITRILETEPPVTDVSAQIPSVVSEILLLPLTSKTTLLELYHEMEIGYNLQNPLKNLDWSIRPVEEGLRHDLTIRYALHLQVSGYLRQCAKFKVCSGHLENDIAAYEAKIRSKGIDMVQFSELCLQNPHSVFGMKKRTRKERDK